MIAIIQPTIPIPNHTGLVPSTASVAAVLNAVKKDTINPIAAPIRIPQIVNSASSIIASIPYFAINTIHEPILDMKKVWR
jgi:hypothetical protein